MQQPEEQNIVKPTYFSREELEEMASYSRFEELFPLVPQTHRVFKDGELALYPYKSDDGIKLWGADYSQIDLSHMVAHGAILDWVKMVQSNLKGVDLTGASATAANFWKANLTKAILKGVNFAGSYLQDVSFTDAQMREVCLVSAMCIGAHFDGADLEGAECAGADFTGATFDHAGLFPVRLYETTYKPGQFDEAGRLFLFDAKAIAEKMYYEDD